ncbi:MAG: hypothetical protein ACOX6Z_04865, partial [Dethiobacteria bacterium]
QEKGFLWGSYDLHLFYCRFVQGAEVSGEKIFQRNFSSPLAVLPVFMDENFDAEKISFTFTDSYNTAVEPLFPALFPLMGRLNYLPFKISVAVTGHIYAVLEEVSVEQERRQRLDGSGGETTADTGVTTKSYGTETERAAVAAGGGDVSGVTVEKTAAGVQGPAAITENLRAAKKIPAATAEHLKETEKRPAATTDGRDAAGVAQASVESSPDPRYYNKYRLFYEYFFPEKHTDHISKGK